MKLNREVTLIALIILLLSDSMQKYYMIIKLHKICAIEVISLNK